MVNRTLEAERTHLASLLEAIQRCVYFLEASRRKQTWPLAPGDLEARRKDVALFESLAAMNERFAKLQDTLGAGMRHAAPAERSRIVANPRPTQPRRSITHGFCRGIV